MKVFSNAKINLGLNILRKRSDGFHDLETVMLPIDLYDEIDIEVSDEFSFKVNGKEIPGRDEENICIKAYQLLKKDLNIPAVQIRLTKNIPIGAGLGGGSSNAAFTIKALNKLFDLKLKTEKMENYARQLGSDCAFFIQNKIAFAEGKGDVFDTHFELIIPDLQVMLIHPNIHVSTATAYTGLELDDNKFSLKKLQHLHLSHWQENIHNDFEKSIFNKYPEIEQIKKKLTDNGAVYSAMSGSGSTVYGLFEKGSIPNLKWPSSYFTWIGEILNN